MESVAVTWSIEEEKSFENAIAMHCVEEEITEDQWMKMASMVPTKSLQEVKNHYQMLLEDVKAIESGQVPLPRYQRTGEEAAATSPANRDCHSSGGGGSTEKKPNHGVSGISSSNGGGRSNSKLEQERKKGIPWTQEEHRFLLLPPQFFYKSEIKMLPLFKCSVFVFVFVVEGYFFWVWKNLGKEIGEASQGTM